MDLCPRRRCTTSFVGVLQSRWFCHRDRFQCEYEYEYRCTEYEYEFTNPHEFIRKAKCREEYSPGAAGAVGGCVRGFMILLLGGGYPWAFASWGS
jgi:hypothetical protein